MSDDPYGREEKQERIAEQKALHRPMRAWYVDVRNSKLQLEHGPFPAFWQELEAWQAWRSVRKLFLRFQDTGEWPSETCAAALTSGVGSGHEKGGDLAEVANENAKGMATGAAALAGASVTHHEQDRSGKDDEEMIREVYEPMRAWYLADSQAGLRAIHGEFPADPSALQAWAAFKDVTVKFLRDGDDSSRPHQNHRYRRKRKRHKFADATTTTTASRIDNGSNSNELVLAAASTLVLHQQASGMSPMLSHEQCQELMLLQMRLRSVQERTINFAAEFEKWIADPDRPKSPPPIYGPDGKRANTAEVRFRQQLERERAEVLAAIAKIQPQAAAALGETPKKATRKLYIPIKEYPNVCFMGLILGPRGNHHKRMERETGCKIRIRGRGSLREGSRGKDMQRDLDDEKDDLHVYIEGPTEDAVQSAVEMVEPLLNPESKAVDELKEKHHMELAEINGTVRADEYCHICGEKGHRQWECPAKQRSYAMANVRCALCGDTSHPTRDCTLNKSGTAQATEGDAQGDAMAQRVKVDSQFLDFMSELGEDPGLGFKPVQKPATSTVAVSVLAPTLQSVHPPPASLASTSLSAQPAAASKSSTKQNELPQSSPPQQQHTITVTPRPIQFAPGQPSHTPVTAQPSQPMPQQAWFSQPAAGAVAWGTAYPTMYNPAQAAYMQQQQYYTFYNQQYMHQPGYMPYMLQQQQQAYAYVPQPPTTQ